LSDLLSNSPVTSVSACLRAAWRTTSSIGQWCPDSAQRQWPRSVALRFMKSVRCAMTAWATHSASPVSTSPVRVVLLATGDDGASIHQGRYALKKLVQRAHPGNLCRVSDSGWLRKDAMHNASTSSASGRRARLREQHTNRRAVNLCRSHDAAVTQP
jgi:hypothetical protein